MIRKAEVKDAPAIWGLVQEAHAKTYYSSIPLSEVKCKRLIAMMIGSQSQFAWVSEKNKIVQGVLLGLSDEPVWSTKKVASDAIFYVRPCAKGDGARMAKRFMMWVLDVPAIYMAGFSASTGESEEAERLYSGLGLTRLGGIYARVIR